MIACAVLLAASCSGGGSGGSAPAVSVSFATSGVTLSEGGAPANVQVVLHTSLVATTGITSVTVFDRATGTASAGSD